MVAPEGRRAQVFIITADGVARVAQAAPEEGRVALAGPEHMVAVTLLIFESAVW